MFAQKSLISHLGRTAVIAGVAAIALTAAGPTSALAGQAEKGLTAATATSGATDFSAQRRYYRRGYGGGGAALAAAAIVGTGIAIAASRPYGYDSYGYYGGPPVAYYESPGYGYGYGGNPYYYNRRPYVGGYNTGQYW